MKYLLVLSLFLFQIPVYSSLSIGDVIISILNIYAFLFTKIKLKKGYFNIILIIFFVWLTMTPLFLNDIDTSFYINRLLRLSNLFIGVLIIPNTILKNTKDLYYIIKFLAIICLFLSILIFVEFFSLAVSIKFDIRLSSRDIEKVALRPYSIFSEPSIAAIVLMMSTFILYSFIKEYKNLKKLLTIVIMINLLAMILTLSFTGLLGVLSILILNLKSNSTKVIIAISFVLFIFITYVYESNFTKNFSERFNSVIAQNDNSSNQRLMGSWIVPIAFVRNIYIGEGTGQESYKLEKYDISKIEFFSQYNLKINNSFALILFENGIIGLTIFILLTISFFKKQKFIPVIICLFAFVHGSYFYGILWITIIILLSTQLQEKQFKKNSV